MSRRSSLNRATTYTAPTRSASIRSRPTARRPICIAPRHWRDFGHQKGGFYHDARFSTLLDVVNHYDTKFNLKLSDADKKDLIEYLKGI
jgi:hypothetical protein